MSDLDFGPLTRDEIQKHVRSPEWQEFRKELKDEPLIEKLDALRIWLEENQESRAAQVQVTNYVNALRRAGYNIQ